LAARLGVRTVTASRWERGRTVLRREFLARVVALLGTSTCRGDGPAEAERPEGPAV